MLEQDPLWYKDAIVYELHVRAFCDSVGDGTGDFRGLTQKLDYLQDLGVTAIWLLPFYPSPLKDDGYDIADYTNIHPHYGRLQDLQEFLEAAHRRGLRVITELVINHTSDQHPWFQRARRAPPGSPERDFYVWSETADNYPDARIIFKDFEHSNWARDPVANAFYWHRFYSHQPDLNYDNPAVWQAIFPVVDFWLQMGVDGLRLDAVPYLFEREGTSCENLPETHEFLRALRRHIDEKFANRMLLAEANQWPEDSAAYFGAGDESHMAFHFPLMPRMFMAIHVEDRFPIMDILAQTPAIPENCQWSLFLRNHDELTLEMVTDEERDYMYRAYAGDLRARINLGIRRRLAPLLGNNRRRIELMNGLLFSLPGTPVLYYGDEIGMGDNIYLGDRNGVRTPMQWSADRNAGFSRANPQKLYLPIIIDPEYHYEALNVEAQQNNPNSLLWWMKRLIALRKRHKAFGRGTLEFLQPANRRILAFVRSYQNEHLLIVANLSRFVQHVELDLAKLQGLTPIELFGRNAFPRIGKQAYPLTLGPHAFYWFVLEAQADGRPADSWPAVDVPGPIVTVRENWEELFRPANRDRLNGVLTRYLRSRPWASGTRAPQSATLRESFRVRYADATAQVCLVNAEYREGPPELFVVPLTAVGDQAIQQFRERGPSSIVAQLAGESAGYLVDALADEAFRQAILQAMMRGKSLPGSDGELVPALFGTIDWPPDPLASTLSGSDQVNSSLIYGDQFILKCFRRVEAGTHPEVELGRHLTETARFPHVAPLLGALEYRRRNGESTTLAVLHRFVANEGTAWQYTLDELSQYFERVLSLPASERRPPTATASPFRPAQTETPRLLQELIGRYLESAELLGRRTAELHLALAAATDNPAFAPEPFTQLYQRSIYQSMRNVFRNGQERLRQDLDLLPAGVQVNAQKILNASDEILGRLRKVLGMKLTAQRMRCHGDYHLDEILYTGKDFVIVDFEGSIRRSLNDRRVKRSPLRDVASMIRSFHYAAASALLENGSLRGHTPGVVRPEDVALLEPWTQVWHAEVCATFLKAYLNHAQPGRFLPRTSAEVETLLEALLLEKALDELEHELDHRRRWVNIPLVGILQILGEHA